MYKFLLGESMKSVKFWRMSTLFNLAANNQNHTQQQQTDKHCWLLK